MPLCFLRLPVCIYVRICIFFTLYRQQHAILMANSCTRMHTGVVSAIVTHPFDTIKTRLQKDYDRKVYPTLADVIKKGDLFSGIGARSTYRFVRAYACINECHA